MSNPSRSPLFSPAGPRLGGHWPVPSNYDLHSQSVRKIFTIYTSNIIFSTNNFACKPTMRLDVSNLCVSPHVITTLQQKQQPNVTLTNTRAVDHIAVLFYFYVYCIMYEENQLNYTSLRKSYVFFFLQKIHTYNIYLVLFSSHQSSMAFVGMTKI